MRVPAADVGEGRFDAEVGLEQLRDLLHVVAEFVVGIFDAGGRLVLGRVGVAQHLDGFEGFFAGGVKIWSPLSPYMAWKALAAGEGVGRGRRRQSC
jgi:hypothetical protein